MTSSPLKTWQCKNPCVMCQMSCEALQQIMKTSLQTKKTTFRMSAAKTADSKPTDGQVAVQIESLRRRGTIATASCERRGVRLRGRAKRGARAGRACQRLPNSGVPRSFRKNLEQETQQTLATSSILPEKTPQNVNKKKPFLQQNPPTPWSAASAQRWNEWRSSFLPRSPLCGETLSKCWWKSHRH